MHGASNRQSSFTHTSMRSTGISESTYRGYRSSIESERNMPTLIYVFSNNWILIIDVN